jgi:hypothetical protein
MKRFWQYTFTLTTSRRPIKLPDSSARVSKNTAVAPAAPVPVAPNYRALNSRASHAKITPSSSEDLLKAADENQNVLASVWL